MPKRKTYAKRSASRLPKGLPVRGGSAGATNPFDVSRPSNKRTKFQVHNRPTHQKQQRPSALQQALERRQNAVRTAYKTSHKANSFVDKRIGEYNNNMTAQEQQLARLVQERSRRSKRHSKFSLSDSSDTLTHKGKAVDQLTAADHVELLSDDDEEDKNGHLDAVDTEFHFGGGSSQQVNSIYGSGQQQDNSMSTMYSQRKNDLDDLILRRKIAKAERLQSKEHQMEQFTAMDESFKDLAQQLQFRDKWSEQQDFHKRKMTGELSRQEQEMHEWDVEMKQYLQVDRRPATDRTKTPQEIAQEEADRLQELETRRLARMNGDFVNDDLTDISDDEEQDKAGKQKKKKRKKNASELQSARENPEALSDSDESDNDDENITTRFTADGLVRVNSKGVVLGKVGQAEQADSDVDDDSSAPEEDRKEDLASDLPKPLSIGTRVTASYHATEQFDGNESWFPGVISKVHSGDSGNVLYDVDYDDGDFEENVQPQHLRVPRKTKEEVDMEQEQKEREIAIRRKKVKAKEKARASIPFVFEVPTTLEALHDIIGNFASTGEDASLIVERIHKANSVRLNKNNAEKMQNFYDVLIRRFIAIGDAVYHSGDGGPELGRYKQLDALTKTMYVMAQDAPDSTGAVWSRRLGFFQNAHTKRLRDAEFTHNDFEEQDFSAWPSTGVLMALRVVGHIFPVTDLRHLVVTPTMLLLGQIIGHTPILSTSDLVMGVFCSALQIEYTREAKRVPPEALGFLAGTIRLFAFDKAQRCAAHPLPSLEAVARSDTFLDLRKKASDYDVGTEPKISLEKSCIAEDAMAAAILFGALHLVEQATESLNGSIADSEREVFSAAASAILSLKPSSKSLPLAPVIKAKVSQVACKLSQILQQQDARVPVQRRLGLSTREKAVKSLAPRLENPDKYSLSKDKGKTATQAAADRARREYKREHKAVARELRLDAAMVENERRSAADQKHAAAKAKRQKAFAWLEGEQATLNQQVRQGGGLLQGGGMGAAKAKAATGKLGIKKGGKF